MFHVENGLFFQRQANGDVVIVKTKDGKEVDGPDVWTAPNVQFAQKIAEGVWVSAMLSMTEFGERPGDWDTWMQHQGGGKDLLKQIEERRDCGVTA